MQRCFLKASKGEAYTKRRCVERQKDQEEIAMAINSRKVAMVGCGFVGSASAFALMQSKLFSEMVLIDADQNRAEGEALDISHGMAFASPMKIYAGTYDDCLLYTSHGKKRYGRTVHGFCTDDPYNM